MSANSVAAAMDEAPSEVDFVPGTELVSITDESHHDHDLLIPRPTADPHDPLNWTPRRKYLTAGVQAICCFLGVTSSLSIGPMYPLFQAEFNLDNTQLNLLTGAAVLLLGYSNFIVVPMTNVFGRRFVMILLSIIAIATSIWEARALSYNSLLAARILNGFSISTTETMMVQIVTDIFFLRDRGFWMGVYFTFFFGGLFIGPVISGNLAARHGWRSYFWLCLAFSVFSLILVLFGYPETKWHRDTNKPMISTMPTEGAVVENHNPASALPGTPTETKEGAVHNEGSGALNDDRGPGPIPVGKGRPSKAAFGLIMSPDPQWKTFIFKDVVSCARIFVYPIVFWAALCLAGPANLLLHWNLTQSAVLGGPPHNFGVSAVGYSNFAFLAGGIVGLCTAGPISDWYVRWATRRNKNIREPEFRLPVLIPYFFLAVVGIVVGACAEQYGWHWAVLVVVGYGFTGLTVTSVPTITTAYAVDSYHAVAGEIMVVGTVVKNTCGFAMSYWVPPLTAEKGYLNPVMVQLGLVAGPMLLGVPLYFYGKSLRRQTRNSWVHQMEADH